ncbi:hypothetical protein ARMGADRAFT_1077843 [Armillaria gallica]|uniref:Uncharacterized protein n=1 Tax=Armillaria gallica TaxID=47427 RepID=A0A2H3DUE0_ARMGA|nr:hypothetical protein ARMGADRAFT_1077843 [Armillaria gallica]
MPSGLVGRSLSEHHSLLFPPGIDADGVLLMAEKSQSLADYLSTIYPCTIVNRGTLRKVKIQPLIGPADDAVYLNPSDIQKLGLNDTGHTIGTRQGPCKVYSGVSFFENDPFITT